MDHNNLYNYCKSSIFQDGFEAGYTKTFDVAYQLLQQIVSKKDLSSIKSKTDLISDPKLKLISDSYYEIFHPSFEILQNSYFQTLTDYFDSFYMRYVTKFSIFLLILFVGYLIYFFFVFKRYNEELIFNRAIFLLIPQKMFRFNTHEQLIRYLKMK
jgi:hypothetical protein